MKPSAAAVVPGVDRDDLVRIARGNHVWIRIAVLQGRLDGEALEVGEGWPELYPSFHAMAAANDATEPLHA